MSDALDAELCQRTWQLLQPGEIDLDGLVIHTDYGGDEETRMHQATLEVGDVIAEGAGHDPGDTYVYSGNDSSEFASNQHQGRTLDDESFVWECQQLLREGSFEVVFYFEAGAETRSILAAARDRGYTATAIRGDAEEPDSAVVA
jgi:hypothetical protein